MSGDASVTDLTDDGLVFVTRETLNDSEIEYWRAFVLSQETAHFTQDPAWPQIIARGAPPRPTRASYWWVMRGERPVLFGAAARQASPVPGLDYYEFRHGPAFADLDVFARWLAWLQSTVRDHALRVRMAPYWRADSGGHQVQECLERAGFVLDLQSGPWATLEVDLAASLDEILSTFSRSTRRALRRLRYADVTITEASDVAARGVLCELHSELAGRVGIEPLSLAYVDEICEAWIERGPGGAIVVIKRGGTPMAAEIMLKHGAAGVLLAAAARRSEDGVPYGLATIWRSLEVAHRAGCCRLDLGGYALDVSPGDALYGVNRAKAGFVPKGQPPIVFCTPHEWYPRPRLAGVVDVLREWRRRRQSPSPRD